MNEIFEIAKRIAYDYINAEIEPAHLLYAVLRNTEVISVLEDLEQDIYYLEEWSEIRIGELPKTTKPTPNLELSDTSQSLLIIAEDIGTKIGIADINPVLLLAALCVNGAGFSYDQLKTFPLKKDEILKSIHAPVAPPSANGTDASPMAMASGQQQDSSAPKFLGKYYHSMNMGLLAEEKAEVVGRDSEIEYTIEILNRYSKPNVLIIGEPGVGKTVLVDGIVKAVVNGKVPANLKNAHVFKLDYSNLAIGASYKGEVEDRLKKAFEEIKKHDKPLLFIDEINVLLTKNQGNENLVNLLKSELDKGDLTFIASSGMDEFRKTIESDHSVSRKFEIVQLDEPSTEIGLKILDSVLPFFINHHDLKMDEEARKESIKLSKRYIKNKRLPDSAIGLIDRTMSNTRVAIGEFIEIFTLMKRSAADSGTESLKDHLSELERLEKKELLKVDKLIELLKEVIDTRCEAKKVETFIDEISDKQAELKKIKSITSTDLTRVVSRVTGIPVGKLQTDEKERLINLEKELTKRVVGQDDAIKGIASAILESRAGLTKEGQPIGSFFLMGPTGTGKTELAKALTEFLFEDENEMIRLDMSEFKEEHSAALLTGAPPGYVGYEEGGLLVNKIREKPYSVVLFDEIEKAHPSVFDIFLQIMDEGKLHDKLGKEGDFSNSVVLFTSNIGSDFIVDQYAKDITPNQKQLMEVMSNFFRPEFLGRLTELISFRPIGESVVIDIINIQLKEIHAHLAPKNITLEILGRGKESFGKARIHTRIWCTPTKRYFTERDQKKLAGMIIYEEVNPNDHVSLTVDGEELNWEITQPVSVEMNEA